MSQNSTAQQDELDDHAGGLIGGVIYAVILALLGYALGYVLLLLAGQNFIMANVANLTAANVVKNIVASQYAGASILPYLFAFLFAVLGLAYGYLKHR